MAKKKWTENTGHEPLLGWALVKVKLRNGQKCQGAINHFDWRLDPNNPSEADILKWRRYDA